MHDFEWWNAIKQKRANLVKWDAGDPISLFTELVMNHAIGVDLILEIGFGDNIIIPEEAVGKVVALDLARPSDSFGVQGDVRSLPFVGDAFDLVCSQFVPGSRSIEVFIEIARVLKPGGMVLGVVDGELQFIETQEVFGRGFQWPPVKPVRFTIPEMFEAVGLQMSSFAEYFGESYYPDIRSFALNLEALPIIPDYNATKDAAFLREVERKLMCDLGIRNTEHMAIFTAYKTAES